MTSSVYYFDHAAATPIDERVISAMMPYFSDIFFNPSSPYEPAVAVRRDYQAAKQQIAKTIGASADELIMTAGATESINIAIRSFGGHKICSAIEHDSVRQATHAAESFDEAPVDSKGRVIVSELAQRITEDTQLVSVALANHELGTVQPIAEIAACIKDIRQQRARAGSAVPLVFHCDASQGLGLFDIHVARLGIDLLTLNAAKIYGPKQVGLLWVRPGVELLPQVLGGGQELGVRSGTENVAGVIGFAEAVRLAEKYRKSEAKRLTMLRDAMQKTLTEAFSDAVVSGSQKHRLANFLHISFPGIDAERLVFMLETKNILVATGSACAANKNTGSKVLSSIGLDTTTAQGSLRLTLGRSTTETACVYVADEIIQAVKAEYDRMKRS